jgi:hypothetical protein
MGYPAYFDLTAKPVRQHPIPTYSQDPDEAGDFHMLTTLWLRAQERRESRRRIAAAIARRASGKNTPSPPLAPDD